MAAAQTAVRAALTAVPDPDARASQETAHGSPTRRWPGRALAVVAALAVVTLVLEVVVLRPRYDAVQDVAASRAAAVRVAEAFAVDVNSYSSGATGRYTTRVDRLLSPSARSALGSAMTGLAALVARTRLRSSGQVLASGISALGRRSARVLVVADATARSTMGTRDRRLRWEVSLVRPHGRWLVDDFRSVP